MLTDRAEITLPWGRVMAHGTFRFSKYFVSARCAVEALMQQTQKRQRSG